MEIYVVVCDGAPCAVVLGNLKYAKEVMGEMMGNVFLDKPSGFWQIITCPYFVDDFIGKLP